MSKARYTGHCYCGAVRFEIHGESSWVGHCHCESCRRASGSVMTTFAGFNLDQVEFSGDEPRRIDTDDGVTRRFCGRCGSPVSYENRDTPGQIHLQLGLFDEPDRLPPSDHSFRDEKVSWLEADARLPDSGWTPPCPQ